MWGEGSGNGSDPSSAASGPVTQVTSRAGGWRTLASQPVTVLPSTGLHPTLPPLLGVMEEKQQAGPGWGARGH